MTINLIKTLPFNNQVEYLVVDDGSRIDEFERIKEFIEEEGVAVKLFRKQNGGKLSAVRYGLEHTSGDFFMDMDDDDLLNSLHLENILDTIELFNKSRLDNDDLCGFCGLCETLGNDVVGDMFPNSTIKTNFLALRADLKIKGDKKEVIKTDIMKSIKINFFENEYRVPTSTQWAKLADYTVLFVNRPFLIKNYLADGLSNNLSRVRIKSPNSSREVYEIRLNQYKKAYYNTSYFSRSVINFYRFSFHGAIRFFPRCRSLSLLWMTVPYIPISFFVYLNDKRKKNIR